MHLFSQPGLHPFLHAGLHPFLYTGLHPFLYTGLHPFIYTGLQPFLYTGLEPFLYTELQPFLYTGLQPFLYTTKVPFLHKKLQALGCEQNWGNLPFLPIFMFQINDCSCIVSEFLDTTLCCFCRNKVRFVIVKRILGFIYTVCTPTFCRRYKCFVFL